MSNKEKKPYGSWKSPIQAKELAKTTVGFMQIATDGDNIYWVESRPNENNRYVIVKYDVKTKSKQDLTQHGFNARTQIYSYGGGALTVSNGIVYFSNYSKLVGANDQRIFRQEPGYEPVPITPLVKKCYGDGTIYQGKEGERLVCVTEDSTFSGESLLSIISVDAKGKKQTLTLVSDQEPSPQDYYYSSPCISPNQKYLAWIRWNKPHTPWDNSELWLAEFDDNGLLIPESQCRLTSDSNVPVQLGESIFQPQWSPDGQYLYFVSDRNEGWWSLYRYSLSNQTIELVSKQAPKQAEFGLPQWILGMSTYAFLSEQQIVCTYTKNGIWFLATIDLKDFSFQALDINLEEQFGQVTDIRYVQTIQGKVVFVAGGPRLPHTVLCLDPVTKSVEMLSTPNRPNQDIQQNLSQYEFIRFETGNEGEVSYGFYYPPYNHDVEIPSPKEECPPLLIKMHGGPTSATSTVLNLGIHYFTSRGFGVIDINYRGSTGFGRAYRLALYTQWGIYDRDDCVNAAKYLAKQNRIDIERVVARGTSAGGYLALVLATYTDLLKAGASTAGISDLLLLYAGTHKFEKYYLDQLIGSQVPDEQVSKPVAERDYIRNYELRSPYYVSDLLKSAMIFFQGTEDPVVPKNQTEAIVKKLQKQGIPVACMMFPHEQHGLRIAKNIIQALEAEFYFYSQMLNFTPADRLKPIPICNWQTDSSSSTTSCCVVSEPSES
jgi:dipeptidyl aminopeptidase/acylaminoacyl peptidase